VYQPWIVVGGFSRFRILSRRRVFSPFMNHSINGLSCVTLLSATCILNCSMCLSAVLPDIVSVSILVTASPSLSGAENESFNALLNCAQVPRLLLSLACVQKDCFHGPAVPSFIKNSANIICLWSVLYVSSFIERYMSVSIRNSSSFFLSPVKGVGVFIFTSF